MLAVRVVQPQREEAAVGRPDIGIVVLVAVRAAELGCGILRDI